MGIRIQSYFYLRGGLHTKFSGYETPPYKLSGIKTTQVKGHSRFWWTCNGILTEFNKDSSKYLTNTVIHTLRMAKWTIKSIIAASF